jgi:hypothetical protein
MPTSSPGSVERLDGRETKRRADLNHTHERGARRGFLRAVDERLVVATAILVSSAPPAEPRVGHHRDHTPGDDTDESRRHLELKIRTAEWLAGAGLAVPTAEADGREYFACFERRAWFGRPDVALPDAGVFVECGGTSYGKLTEAFGFWYDLDAERVHPTDGCGEPSVANAVVLTPYRFQEWAGPDQLGVILLTPGPELGEVVERA